MAETEEVKSPASNKRPLSDVEGEAHANGKFLEVPIMRQLIPSLILTISNRR